MKLKIPNLKKILKPTWLHKPGWGVNSSGWIKQKIWTQATIPKDPNILQKLGIKKGGKILAIAGFYGDWAEALAKAGTKVDYSDVSRSIVNYVKRHKRNIFGKYVCSNYVFIPKKAGEYDWTFTFEACGSKQGLPLAYLRSLLNEKGGILVVYFKKGKHLGGKAKNYSRFIKRLAGIYNIQYNIKTLKIKTYRKGEGISRYPHRVYTIRTNNSAREKAELDLRVLDYIQNKRVINLDRDTEKLKLPEKEFEDSIKRLNRLTKILGDKFKREIDVR